MRFEGARETGLPSKVTRGCESGLAGLELVKIGAGVS